MKTSWLIKKTTHKIKRHFHALWFCLPITFFSIDTFAHKIRFVGEQTIPLLYENTQQVKVGAMLELAQVLSDHIKVEATFEILPWARAYETALQEPDVVLIAALKTPQREQELQWIGKVLEAKANLIALKERSDIKINHIDQAKEYVVASVRGYGAAKYLVRQGLSEERNLVLTSQQSQMWRLLFSKRVDLVVANLEIGRFETQHIGLEPTLMHSTMQILELKSELQFATGLSTSDYTVKRLRDGLKDLKEDGSYQAILRKWNLN